jgi:hypothetical protein
VLRLTLFLVVGCLLLSAGLTRAQSGGGYDLTWSSVDGGGAMWSTDGSYSLGGTAGQPDAGPLTGGGYTLVGGFWSGGLFGQWVYLPLVLRSY